MEWTDVSEKARKVMRELGNFSPTARESDAQVKGWGIDEEGTGKVYWDSADLRNIAAACAEVADWLDKRKAAAT